MGRGGGYKTRGGTLLQALDLQECFMEVRRDNGRCGVGCGRGGAGACEVLPLRKGGGDRKSFGHAEEGHNKFWISFYEVA